MLDRGGIFADSAASSSSRPHDSDAWKSRLVASRTQFSRFPLRKIASDPQVRAQRNAKKEIEARVAAQAQADGADGDDGGNGDEGASRRVTFAPPRARESKYAIPTESRYPRAAPDEKRTKGDRRGGKRTAQSQERPDAAGPERAREDKWSESLLFKPKANKKPL